MDGGGGGFGVWGAGLGTHWGLAAGVGWVGRGADMGGPGAQWVPAPCSPPPSTKKAPRAPSILIELDN